MNTFLLCIVAIALLVRGCDSPSSSPGSQAVAPPTSPSLIQEAKGFPLYGVTPIKDKAGFALASSGVYYLLGNNVVHQLNAAGEMVRKLTATSAGAIATDAAGNLYAVAAPGKIFKYAPDGTLISEISLTGPTFSYPSAIRVDAVGNIFVAAYYTNNAVYKYDASGTVIGQIDNNGATDIAFDSAGNMYLPYGYYVRKLDPSGAFLLQIGSAGNPPFASGLATNIAIDTNDEIYVSNNGTNCEIVKLDVTGNVLSTFTLIGDDGRVYQPGFGFYGGRVYVVFNYQTSSPEWAAGGQGHVYQYTGNGALVQQMPEVYTRNFEMSSPQGLTLASDGSVFVGAQDGYLKFDSTGHHVASIKMAGSTTLAQITSVALDASQNLYLAQSSTNQIFKFGSDGTFKLAFGQSGTGNGQFNNVLRVTVDKEGNLLTVDTTNNRIQKFDSGGNYVSQFGSAGSGPGEFSYPFDAKVDSDGNIWVADAMNSRLQKFDSQGQHLATIGQSGAGDGEFGTPVAIYIDSQNRIFVADAALNRIQEFDSNGGFVNKFGSAGTGSGQFTTMASLTGDSFGHLYVSDSGANRIQKFTLSGTVVVD